MSDPLDSVNDIARRYREAAAVASAEGKTSLAAQHNAVAESLSAAAAELARLRIWAKPIPASYGDLSDLPSELISQLSGIKTDELEDQIFAIVKSAGDEIELDRLLIELFRKSGVVHQRRFINNKAYRMAQKGLIHIVAGRKGVYTVALGVTGGTTKEDERSTQENPDAPSSDEPAENFDLDGEIPF